MQWLLLIFPLFYATVLAYFRKHLLKDCRHEGTGIVHEAFVSVIIPCRNEEQHLPLILSDLLKQTYPPGLFEVIIVDDNSSDSTLNIASDFKGIRNYCVLTNEGDGKKKAIRTAVGKSAGQLVVTTDADCRLNEGWLAEVASFYTQEKPDLIICPVKLGEKPGMFGRFQALEFLSLQGITAGAALSGHPVLCNGANLAFSKQAYLRNAGNLHDEVPSGDDIFLLHSIRREGGKIRWLGSMEAAVISAQAGNPGTFIKQRKRWLSKWRYYTDTDTIILGIVTFVTNILLIWLLVATLLNSIHILLFIAAFIIKVIPDYLILSHVTTGYRRKPLMKWFLPSMVIYPFYVLIISVLSLFSSPSPRET
jgi:glycosyltransferase involved in cell wall biosynthesis